MERFITKTVCMAFIAALCVGSLNAQMVEKSDVPMKLQLTVMNAVSNSASADLDDMEVSGERFTPDPCPVVTNLQAEVQGTDVKLTWAAAIGNPTGYKVFDETGELATVTVTEYVVKNFPDGSYTFAVAAIYDDDCTIVKVTTTATINVGNPIKNLNGACNDATLTLTWDEPDAKRDEFIVQWSAEPNNGIGTACPCELWPTNRWTPADLKALGITTGMMLETVSFVPYTSTIPPVATFTIKVWQGGSWSGSTGDPGTELVSQPVTPVFGYTWQEVPLDTPVAIDASQELWIGYQMIQKVGHPAGCDPGPAIANKGNICYDASIGMKWTTMNALYASLVYNWCVRGKITSEPGVVLVTNYDIYQDDTHFDEVAAPATTYTQTGVEGKHDYCVVAVYDNGAQSQKVCKEIECSTHPEICNPATDLKVKIPKESACVATLAWTAAADMPDAEYNVYRGDAKIATIKETEYVDNDIEANVEYTWTVKTDCNDREATGISVTGECIRVGINELNNSVAIYPNPTTGEFRVSSFGVQILNIEILDVFGRSVDIAHPPLQEGLGGLLPAGIYFVRITTEENVIIKKIIKYY